MKILRHKKSSKDFENLKRQFNEFLLSFSNNAATNSRSRANWRDMATNITCGKDTFICGLEIYMEGKFTEIRKSTEAASFEEFTVTESSNTANIQFEENSVDFEASNDILRKQ